MRARSGRFSLAPLGFLAMAAAACGELPDATLTPGNAEFSTGGSCMTSTTPQGVDVSHGNGTIDWAAVANAGVSFGIAKATEGVTIQDAEFANNWSGMQQHGVIRGAYHFFHPGDDGATQADDFLAEVNAAGAGHLGDPGTLPPFLDWEVIDSATVAQSVTSAQNFINEIQAKTGLTTIIYTYPNFWSSTLSNPPQFAGYPLWFANYGVSCPNIPAPWSSWLFWQYNDTGTVPGITSNVDQDVFNGTLAQLQALGGDGGIVVPPPQDAGPSSLLTQVSGNESLTMVNWPDQHMELFGHTPSGAEVHSATTATGDGWSAPAQLDVGAACGSAAAYWGGRWVYPELFSPLNAGGTGHLWWTSGTGWNTYQPYGGSGLGHLSTLTWADGHVEVFALGADRAIWHDFWDQTANNWSGWTSLGGTFATGASALMASSTQGALLATDPGGVLWRASSGSTCTNGWCAWTRVAAAGVAMASRPVPVRWPDQHLTAYVRGQDDFLYGVDFSASQPVLTRLDSATRLAGDPLALMNSDGSGAEVFARSTSGAVVYLTWTGSGYSSLQPLGSQLVASDPFAWIRGDGNAEVFAIDGQGNLVHSYRDPTSGWQAWAAIGAGFDSCAASTPQADGGMEADAGITPDAGPAQDGGATGGGTTSGSNGGGSTGSGSNGGGSTGGAGDGGSQIWTAHSPSGCGCTSGGDLSAGFTLIGLAAFLRRRRQR